MERKTLDYIKLVCLVLLTLSAVCIAWQLSEIIYKLQLIYEKINSIYNVINAYQYQPPN